MAELTDRDFHQARFREPLLFEMARSARTPLFERCEETEGIVPSNLCREELDLPQLSEVEVVRHFTRLSEMTWGVDLGIYPLGSCTMKYNPKICEDTALHPGAVDIHPAQEEGTVQGALQLMYELQEMLGELGGMEDVSLQPAAGAHGEFTGMLMAHKYHEVNGDPERDQIILPDTAHGTNPASASMLGYEVVEIRSAEDGCINLDALKDAASERTAAFMLTNPNTLGIFEKDVKEVAGIIHDVGALLYYDGANLNAVLGKTTPGKMGYDIVHFNLHKTFATPHGGGGPGSGPVGVIGGLSNYLPVPIVDLDENDGTYFLDYDRDHSVGKIRSFFGNFGVFVKAYTYLRMIGSKGVEDVAEISVLNSNYMKYKLRDRYPLPHKDLRKHEFVISGKSLKDKGLRTLDIAKRLLDYGVHPPTIYFPLIVDEALMVEPTETEPKSELDRAVEAFGRIAEEDVELVKGAPHNAAVGRLDEVRAARKPILSWMMYEEANKEKEGGRGAKK